MSEIIAFIGGGNMAASLIGGLLAAGHSATCIRVAEPDSGRAQALRERFGVAVSATGSEVIGGAQTLVLAVKPQQMASALKGLKPDSGACVVSIAAGIRIDFLCRALGSDAHYVRSMPNTPALYGCGISGLYANSGTPTEAKTRAETVLRAAGEICWLQHESELDAVTAVSGSGPAYFFLLVEAMREAGVALGLAPETAAQLAARTCIGAARMIEAGTTDVAELRAQVTSKGGTTEAALKHLENAGLRPMIREALAAAARRAVELGDELATSSSLPQ
ncbi:MAG: pyrroline-5-carboxylate reductase [Panacagrimonas sp.]